MKCYICDKWIGKEKSEIYKNLHEKCEKRVL